MSQQPGLEVGPRRIHCWINDEEHLLDQPEARLVLDYLRRSALLRGTKEGCREGDCGACVVMLGELYPGTSPRTPASLHTPSPATDWIRYRPVTSCLLPVAELHGKHLVTVEGLLEQDAAPRARDRRATPVQKCLVEEGASQCGFCTPGIVVSLTAMALEDTAAIVGPGNDPTGGAGAVERALSGHLCRCTGYRSLRRTGERLLGLLDDLATPDSASPDSANPASSERTAEHARQRMASLVEDGWVPPYFLEIPARLAAIAPKPDPPDESDSSSAQAQGPVVAGGTDLYVQRGDSLPRRPVRILAQRRDLREICLLQSQAGDSEVRVGAMATFEDLVESKVFRLHVPKIADHMRLIASWQVRHRATVGGNLVNASPIGDVTVLLLAQGAVAVLESRLAGGPPSRTRLPSTPSRPAADRPVGPGYRHVPLEDFYLGYKELDLRPDEILAEIRFPVLGRSASGDGDRCTFQKVSKRPCLDIATVNAAARVRVEGGVIVRARLAAGGVAPVPLFLRRTSAALEGLDLARAVAPAALNRVLALAQDEASPIDDVRGSAAYKRILLHNLLLACCLETLPEAFSQPETSGAPGAGPSPTVALGIFHGPS